MRIQSILMAVLLVVTGSLTLKGQQVSTMYYMNLPQNHFFNPALKPTNGAYIGLPAVSGVNVNFNTNFIGFSDVFRKSETGDSVISVLHPDFDTDGFLAKIKSLNYINPDVNLQLFGLGFRAGKDLYIFIDINEKITGRVSLPGDIFELALRGNEGFIGSMIDLQPLDASLMYHREIAAGFSKDITKRLRIGVRGRVLFGIASLSMENHTLGISVLDDYSHKMITDVDVNVSGPITVVLDEDNMIDDVVVDEARIEDPHFWLNTSNPGFGFDIGAVYQLTPKISLSAAVNGFGYIKWNSEVTNLNARNEFLFSGFDISDLIEGTRTFDEIAEELVDSLKNSFTVTDQTTPFTTMLPGYISLGASYNISDNLLLGLVSSNMLINGRLRSSMMLSANANLGSSLSLGLSYTAINRSWDNLGAGLSLRIGPFQFYTVADKIPIMYNKIVLPENEGSSTFNLLLPDKWNMLTVRAGMNLVFGNRIKKRSDRPMIITTEEI